MTRITVKCCLIFLIIVEEYILRPTSVDPLLNPLHLMIFLRHYTLTPYSSVRWSVAGKKLHTALFTPGVRNSKKNKKRRSRREDCKKVRSTLSAAKISIQKQLLYGTGLWSKGFIFYVLLVWHLLGIYKIIYAKKSGFYFRSDTFMEN